MDEEIIKSEQDAEIFINEILHPSAPNEKLKQSVEGFLTRESIEEIKLEEVLGSSCCQFSVIENKLAKIYRNQEKILKAIKLLSNGN